MESYDFKILLCFVLLERFPSVIGVWFIRHVINFSKIGGTLCWQEVACYRPWGLHNLSTSFHLCSNDLIATIIMYSDTKRTLSRQSTLPSISIHLGNIALVISLLYLEGDFPSQFPSVFSLLFIELGSLHTRMLWLQLHKLMEKPIKQRHVLLHGKVHFVGEVLEICR